MTQYNFENINPYVDTGVDLAADLNSWKDAVQSCHKGSTRPAYAVAGTLWINDTANPWKVNVYDGAEDVEIGAMSTTTNVFYPTGAGSFKGIYTASTTQTLPVSSAGTQIGITLEGIALTLPARSLLQTGSTFFIKNISGSSASTVLPPSGDGFRAVNGVNLYSISLGAGDEVRITNAGGTWWVSGPAVAKYQAVFGSSLSASGYQKLPSGLIIQWGAITVAGDSYATVTFPIAFPSFCAQAFSNSIDTYGATYRMSASSWGQSDMRIANTYTASIPASWFAIGY